MKSCNIYGIKRKPGKLYRPSNVTEGEIFEWHLCEECKFDVGENCEIHDRALLFDVDEPEYPKEWCIDENGDPCCTKWEAKQ